MCSNTIQRQCTKTCHSGQSGKNRDVYEQIKYHHRTVVRLEELLRSGNVFIGDGSMMTYITEIVTGRFAGEPLDAAKLSITHGDAVKDAAEAYIEAGSKVLSTFTWPTSRPSEFEKNGFYFTAGCELGMQVARAHDNVAYLCSVRSNNDSHRSQGQEEDPEKVIQNYIQLMHNAHIVGVRDFFFETFSAIADAKIAVTAFSRFKEDYPDVQYVVSFVPGNNEGYLNGRDGGDPIQRIEEVFAIETPVLFGFSCRPFDVIQNNMDGIARISSNANIPLIIAPNGASPNGDNSKYFGGENPTELASKYVTLLNDHHTIQVANFCCGTNPSYVQALRSELSNNTF